MEVKELRIGNYVYPPDNDHTLWEVALDDFYYFYGGLKRFDSKPQPIPLTEQWLLDFGFKNEHAQPFEYYSKKIAVNYQIHVLTPYKSNIKEVGLKHRNGNIGYILSDKIYHVHQLQNLYFALTGKELTLKK